MEQQDSSGVYCPKVDCLNDFLREWVLRLQDTSWGMQSVDTSATNSSIRDGVEAIVKATGHSLLGAQATALLAQNSRRLLLIETIFADTETRPDALDRILNLYRLTVVSISHQKEVSNTSAVNIVYCSIDKERELLTIARWVNKINGSESFVKFLLVPYMHPSEGYDTKGLGHVDALRLPNKFFVENALKLSEQACHRVKLERAMDWEYVAKLSIDDDDQLLPWAFEQIMTISEDSKMHEGRDLKAIGIASQFVYYPNDGGRVDLADMSVVVTGSKFFVSTSWERISSVTPWMLPEQCTANVARSFRARNIDLHVVHDSRPFLIYVRTLGSLSSMDKSQHYRSEPKSQFAVGSAEFAVEAAKKLDFTYPSSFGPVEFSIDPPSLTVSAQYDETSGRLEVSGNFEEYLSSRNIERNGLVLVLNSSDASGTVEVSSSLSDPIEIDASTWQRRAIARIEDAAGNNLGSAWVRGRAKFLS